MSPSEQFDHLLQALALHWSLVITAPVAGAVTMTGGDKDPEIALQLLEAQGALAVGASVPLGAAGDACSPFSRHALQVFLLQRNFTDRLGSRVCYAWQSGAGRIAAHSTMPLTQATPEDVLRRIDELAVRLQAVLDILPVFSACGPDAAAAADIAYPGYV
jgi:hypothetical protein